MFIKLNQSLDVPGCSFLPAGFAVMLRHSTFFGKDVPRFITRLCFMGGGGWKELNGIEMFCGSSSETKVSSSEDFSQMLAVLFVIGGVEIDEGNGSWSLSLSLCCSNPIDITAIVARIKKRLGDRFRSF